MQHPSLCLKCCVLPCSSNRTSCPSPAQPSPAGALQTDACVGFSTHACVGFSLVPALPWTQISPPQLPRTGPSQKGKLCCTVEALTGEWHKLWRHSPKQDVDSVPWGLVHGESKNQLEPS